MYALRMVYVHVRTRPHAAESMCARKAWAAGGTRQPAGGRRARLRRRAACCALSDGRRKQTKLIGAVAPLARPLLPGRAPCEAAQLAALRPPTPLPSALAALAPPPGLPLRAAPLPPPAAPAGLRRPPPQRVTITGSKPPGSDGDSGQARTYTSYPPTLRATKLASPT